MTPAKTAAKAAAKAAGVLPDVLAPRLDVVFCGSAAGRASALAGAYYAGPGNKFWRTLHEVGLTNRVLRPRDYALTLTYGIGLTDMNKHQSGGDRALTADADTPDAVRRKIEENQPAFLAFNGKRAAQAFLGRKVTYGRQPETVGPTAIFALPSTSGNANRYWDADPWRDLAAAIAARHLADPDEALLALDGNAKEDMRVALNRRLFHRMGLDLRKKRDEAEFASRMTSPQQVATARDVAAAIADEFLAAAVFLPRPGAGHLRDLAAEFFALYPERPVQDNDGGIKFADSFWLFVLVRLIAPTFIVESGTHKGHSSWLLRQACPGATLTCFDVSFRNLVWRDDEATYHEHDWMESGMAAPEGEPSLIYFDDHISHAQRIREAHARGFRTLLFDDDFAAHQLHATGHPPAPTLAMLFDASLQDGERITWLRHGKEKSLKVDGAETAAARQLVQAYAKTPDLGPHLRVRPQSGLAAVLLKD